MSDPNDPQNTGPDAEPGPVPLGKAIRWTPADLARLSEFSDADRAEVEARFTAASRRRARVPNVYRAKPLPRKP